MATKVFSILLTTLIACSLGGAPTSDAEDWVPSKYGAEDTLGAINELSAEKVLQAAKLITQGKTYSLGIETGASTPAFPPRGYRIAIFDHNGPEGGGTNKITGNDDLIMTHLGVGSQIDGLGHVGIDFVHYNGNKASDFVRPDGLTKFGTHLLPPIVSRGVLLDVAAHRGVKRLPKGSPIHREEIQAIVSKAGVEIGAGDVVLLHTGWGSLAGEDAAEFMTGEPGLGLDGAEYLASKNVTAVGADGWGLEVLPGEQEGVLFPVHQFFLAKKGIYILENMNTAELAADGVTEFMFVLGQPKFVGAVQVVINPIGIR
jgi:hypothetical protein